MASTVQKRKMSWANFCINDKHPYKLNIFIISMFNEEGGGRARSKEKEVAFFRNP